MTKLQNLTKLGQSIWYDHIRRALIDSGELQELIDSGVMGITSNPSIFEKAISGSADYDEAIRSMAAEGKSAETIYEILAIEDIQRAADMLRPIYDRMGSRDGYISLEVSPTLAHDTEGTISEALRLHGLLDRPNVMIKVPATPAGIPAVQRLIGEGININVTLIFGLSAYEAVSEAYIAGLETLAGKGGDIGQVASVASFFVSRVDTAVDEALSGIGNTSLQGRIAIANSKVAYGRFREILAQERWQMLARQGARVQRLLWASTETKNPVYPDTFYVDALIGADTVNTVPPATLNAFVDHGTVAATLAQGLDDAKQQLAQLAEMGIDLEAITRRLLDEGVAAFAKSFESLMTGVHEKLEKFRSNRKTMQTCIGRFQPAVNDTLKEMNDRQILKRIWRHDHTVWRPEPTEITNRLGWLHSAETMTENIDRIMGLVDAVRTDGYNRALLIGMGGSSLAPEVFQKVFGKPVSVDNPFLEIAVFDSTDPDMLLEGAEKLDLARTLFIVATKSGGTVETLSAFKYFYNQMEAAVGKNSAGRHFIAITDPGSSLVNLADRYKFRDVFLNDPNIGGRYAALSFFGLVPAGLAGVDIRLLLDRAQTAVCNAQSCNCPIVGDNRAALLGAIMGELTKAGRDKLTIVASSAISSFCDWVEQLIAESTGKEGKGILPVVGEKPGLPDVYGQDRLFVYLRLENDTTHDGAMVALQQAGHPVVTITLKDPYDLGEQFFLWEMATVIAGAQIGINPFDQPDVEAAKVLARKIVKAYMEKGELPAEKTIPITGEALNQFLAQAKPGDYVAIQAYVNPTSETVAALERLRHRLRDRLKLATTLGYGPRFLHSTGQLHKGDSGNGLFIQLTADVVRDVPIPDEAGRPEAGMTFGVLKKAQAIGDAQALKNAGRRVICFNLGKNAHENLDKLSKEI